MVFSSLKEETSNELRRLLNCWTAGKILSVGKILLDGDCTVDGGTVDFTFLILSG